MMDRDDLARVIGRHVGQCIADPAHLGEAADAILNAVDEYAGLLADPTTSDEQCPTCGLPIAKQLAAVDRLAAPEEKPCPSCNGRGSWWPEDAERSDLKAVCQVCNGTGRLAAPGPKEATT